MGKAMELAHLSMNIVQILDHVPMLQKRFIHQQHLGKIS
jgi:hypothetical protein